MTEEEIIEKIKTYLDIENNGFSGHLEAKIVQGLLDLYNKQQKEIERLKNAEEYAKLGKETLLDTIHKQENEIASKEKQIKLMQSCDLAKVIRNLQEEIEERETRLQEEINENCKLKAELYGNSISKDKIKDNIKELEEKAEKVKEHYRGTYACLDEYLNAKSKIQGYKELLED